MNTAQQIEKIINKIECRYPDFSNDRNFDILAIAILLNAKMIREVGNEIVAVLEEIKNNDWRR